MRRLLKTCLSLVTLKKTLGFGNFFSATKFDFHLDTPKLKFQKVLICSPHPDDDTFSMAGTIKKMTTAGSHVTVAYFCDGSGGVPEQDMSKIEMRNEGYVNLKRNPNLVEQRKTEAQAAAQILGIQELVFWGYPDGKLAAGTSAIRALQDLIKRVKPDIIFLPSFLDNHADHRVVNEIFINAGQDLAEAKSVQIWAYEIWTPILVNRLVDITLYIKTKQEAMLAHTSQIEARGYDKAIVGLNQYRAEINKISGYAEGFFASSFELYKELYKRS